MIEKGMVMDLGSMNTISDQRERVTDQDMNHSRAPAVRHSEMSEKDSGASDPVQVGQARTRKYGKIPHCFGVPIGYFTQPTGD